jgi:cystathionine gamma-synthase
VLTALTLPVKTVYYPKYNATKVYYDNCRKENGGYGGLVSTTFHKSDDAIRFYDALQTAKGPSLGTNFTLRFVFLGRIRR